MKVKRFLGVCVDGYPFVGVFLAVTLVALWWQNIWVALPFVVLTLWCLWFFRDPDRKFEGTADANQILCPADGKIVACQKVAYPYLIEGEAMRVSVYMNIFNVHINRFPLEGTVLDTKYTEGSYHGAFEDKASLENEQMGVLFDHNGQNILMVQIAGLIARRIICRVKKGETLQRGEKFGLIRFGSRVDLYLPVNSTVDVTVGQKVYSGKTCIGKL